jgi:hypothetical protein
MICRRRGGVLVALFLGNHEECHSWLRGSGGLLEAHGEQVEVSPDHTGERELLEEDLPIEQSTNAERKYTDRELRAVFAGLCSTVSGNRKHHRGQLASPLLPARGEHHRRSPPA